MLIYWILFLIPCVFVFTDQWFSDKTKIYLFWAYGFFCAIIIGFRFEVGADWGSYLKVSELYKTLSLKDIIFRSDHGYYVSQWISSQLGTGVYGVNFLCGIIFLAGLLWFARIMPHPWIAVSISVPYLLIAVAMGYSRQGAAFGLELVAFRHLLQRNTGKFFIAVVFAALFHQTIGFLLIFGVFHIIREKQVLGNLKDPKVLWKVIMAVLLMGILLYLSYGYVYRKIYDYTVNPKYSFYSGGALPRAFLNLLPSVVFLIFYKKWKEKFTEPEPWTLMIAMIFVLSLLTGLFSTIVDRMMIYLSPIQLVVWSRIPEFMKQGKFRYAVIISILLVYGLMLFVWLHYGTHARYWLPYKNILFF